MSKLKKIYILILWILLWWSITFLWFYYLNENYWLANNTIRVDSTSMIDNIKNRLSNISVWQITETKNWEYQEKFNKIRRTLEERYYYDEDLDYDKMMEAAIKAFVEATWDPYKVYLTDEENQSFQEWLEWQQDFEWIWAVVTKRQDWVMIEELIQGSPAFNAWLKPMDTILEINWTWTQDLSLQESVDKIRGPKWTKVDLRILRKENSAREFLDVEVVRDEINVPSVRWEEIKINDEVKAWYIKISIFGEDTEDALRELIESFDIDGLNWLIIDLRGNWWWYLPMAVNIASYFLPEWTPVVETNYRTYPAESYESQWHKDIQELPMTILVDWISASASEIIAAALSEWKGAKIVWQKTFWKWSIQTLENFDDWSSLKYTIWAWYPPSWESIDREGIHPDYEVEYDTEKYEEENIDTQKQKAKEVLKEMINN